MAITPIGHRHTPLFQQNLATYQDVIRRGHEQEEQSRPHLPPPQLPNGRWQYRHVTSGLSALPLLPGLPPAAGGVSEVWRHFQQGNNPAVMSGISRLSQLAGSSIGASQTINLGLFEMFMAQDRYHQARIEEAVKMAAAEKENSRFHWEASLDDLLKIQTYDNLTLEMMFRLAMSQQATCSRIIGNV